MLIQIGRNRMQIVIDSNKLQSEELRAFLSLSPENKAVITDYVAMEAFQVATPARMEESWIILKDFPNQVLVLKGNWASSLVDPCLPNFAENFIDKGQTEGFKSFSSILENAQAGNKNLQNQLLQRVEIADDHLARILKNSENMKLDIAEFTSIFNKDEIRRIRLKEPWKQGTAEKFFNMVIRLSERSFAAHPDKPKFPYNEHLFNHFLYRHSLAHCVYLMLLVSKGNIQRNAILARNDAVDVVIITFATYFNGFMSKDYTASCIYSRTRYLLAQHGAFIPEDYQDKYAFIIADFLETK